MNRTFKLLWSAGRRPVSADRKFLIERRERGREAPVLANPATTAGFASLLRCLRAGSARAIRRQPRLMAVAFSRPSPYRDRGPRARLGRAVVAASVDARSCGAACSLWDEGSRRCAACVTRGSRDEMLPYARGLWPALGTARVGVPYSRRRHITL